MPWMPLAAALVVFSSVLITVFRMRGLWSNGGPGDDLAARKLETLRRLHADLSGRCAAGRESLNAAPAGAGAPLSSVPRPAPVQGRASRSRRPAPMSWAGSTSGVADDLESALTEFLPEGRDASTLQPSGPSLGRPLGRTDH